MDELSSLKMQQDANDYNENDDDDDNDDVTVFARMTLHANSAHCALEASPLSPADHIIIIHHTSISYISIIIIITRPRPAFGRLGLGGLSGGNSSHG